MDLCGQKYNSPVMKAMSKQMMFGKTGRRKWESTDRENMDREKALYKQLNNRHCPETIRQRCPS